jgi:hypothetical protein
MPSRVASRPKKLAAQHEAKQVDEDATTDVQADRAAEEPARLPDRTYRLCLGRAMGK